jgi:hypothetical protein
MKRLGSMAVPWVMALNLGCDAGAAAGQAQALTVTGQHRQELRVYTRSGPGVYETNRHANGAWDPIDRPALGLFGTVVQAAGVGRDGYLFVYDGRAGGTLLRESPGDIARIVPLPAVPAAGGPPFLRGGDPVDIGGTLTVCGTTLQGKLLVTTQASDGTFSPWDDLEARAGVVSSKSTLSCTRSGQQLHACAVDSAGQVRHTVRAADGTWQAWDDVEEVAGDIGAATGVQCRGQGFSLYVLARSERGAFLAERRSGGAWRAWQHLGEVLADPRGDQLEELAVVNGEVHATGRGDSGVWHTIRHRDRTWDPIEDLQAVVPGYPTGARAVRILSVEE